MKIRILLLSFMVTAIGLINSEVFGTTVKYDRTAALNYSKLHCSSATYNLAKYKCFNPKNPNCESTGTDCANFISQALIDGGMNFDCHLGKGKGDKARADRRELVEGSVVIGKDGKTTGIRSANDLYFALEDSFCFKQVSASEAKNGDMAAWRIKGGNWVHHVVILNEEGYYAGHTSDVCFVCREKERENG
ncbi:MAG: hypothetical protein FJ130_10905 [Deltaproteobacteria bacterium]|nr:hypothetical protein [Deltaproteobacteria bacterium]